MRSMLECLLKAIHCEGLARASLDHSSRRLLTTMAEHWRTLAEVARIAELQHRTPVSPTPQPAHTPAQPETAPRSTKTDRRAGLDAWLRELEAKRRPPG